jgi:hypothetical protein
MDIKESIRGNFRKFSRGLMQPNYPVAYKAILKSVNQFSVKNYNRSRVKGIEVFEHKLVNAKSDISHYLDLWMGHIPKNDLEFISRIYVITREKRNASGTYTPILNSIALLWENSYKDKSLLFRFFSRITEHVFYHEIGHHKYKHTFGTDPEQEKEADRYAFVIIRKKYPISCGFIKFLRMMGLKSSINYYRWGL